MITKEEAQRAYAQLLSFRRQEILVKSKDFPGRIETHHILPLSMGGLDTEENKIDLLAKEHFMAHVYLWAIHRFGEFHAQATSALMAMHKGSLKGLRQDLRECILASEEYQQAREDFSKLIAPILSEANKGSNNQAFGKHWYKDPNSNKCSMFHDGDQPNGWIRGKHLTENELKQQHASGKVWITNCKSKINRLVTKDEATDFVNSGEWRYGHVQKPISEVGLVNIRKALKINQYYYRRPANKGKSRYINTTSKEIRFFADDEPIPPGFAKIKKKMSEEEYNKLKEFNEEQNQLAKKAWLQETQEMADYYTDYGYEATCKKFNVSMSQESMLMRFIRCRKLYGIHFEGMRLSGKKRIFKTPPPEDLSNQH